LLLVGAFGALGASGAVCGDASADTPRDRAAEAARLFNQGRTLAEGQKYDAACENFSLSYDLDPAQGTLLNLADCQEHLGQLGRAWWLFDKAAREAERDGNAKRSGFARERAQALEPKLGAVIVRIADPRLDQLVLTVAGHLSPTTAERRVYVDPGPVEVELVAPERRVTRTVQVVIAGTKIVEIPRLDGGPATPGEPGRAPGWVHAAELAAALGGAAVIASGVFGISAVRNYHDAYTTGLCFHAAAGDQCSAAGLVVVDRAHTRANLSTGLFVGGAALLGTGLALYLRAPRAAVEVAPTASPTTVGVAISGRF
jgi:hypothetical protein